jgi:hypothetical protein
MLEAYRRRRALRRYLRSIASEVYDRQRTFELEELEGELLARRPDITSRLMKDILTRTDILIQQVDRQVEALRARHGNELRELRAEIESLRAALEALRSEVERRPRAPLSPEETSAQSPAGRSLAGE